MNPWFAKSVMLLASVVMVVIRAPHGNRSRRVKVARRESGRVEMVVLTLAWTAFFVPLVWVVTPLFSFADYPLRPALLAAGAGFLASGLWLFHRSHADLGAYWSVTLEVREAHALVTGGVYHHVRHPMYTALFLYALGQALVVPNWLAGSSYGVAFLILLASRVRAEERMMLDAFGDAYASYMSRTKRLIPGVW